MKKLIIIIAIAALFIATKAYAVSSILDRSYDPANWPPMYLNTGVTATSTTVKLAAPLRNGASQIYTTTTGGILEFANLRFTELLAYTGATVNSTTKEITLQGVTRGFCWDRPLFASCEAGRQWPRGTKVTLTNDHRLFVRKMNIDRPNTTTLSGAIICGSTTQPCIFPGEYTTAQKNAFTYTNSNAFHILYDSTLGVPQLYSPATSSYISFGSGSTVNATVSAGGKVQLAGTGELIQQTYTSATTGVAFVPQMSLFTMTGGELNQYEIPILTASGVLATSVGSTGTGSYSNSGVTFFNATKGYFDTIIGTSSGDVLKWNGGENEWVSGPSPALTNQITVLMVPQSANAASVSDGDIDSPGYTVEIGTGTLAAGETIHVDFSGEISLVNSDNGSIDVSFGVIDLGNLSWNNTSGATNSADFSCHGVIGIISSSVARSHFHCSNDRSSALDNDADGDDVDVNVTINTNVSNILQLHANSTNGVVISQFTATKFPSL